MSTKSEALKQIAEGYQAISDGYVDVANGFYRLARMEEPATTGTVPTDVTIRTPEPAVVRIEPAVPVAYDYDADIKPRILALVKKDRDAAIKTLADFGAKKGTEVDAADYPALVASIDAQLGV